MIAFAGQEGQDSNLFVKDLAKNRQVSTSSYSTVTAAGRWKLLNSLRCFSPGSANEYDNYAYALDAAGEKEEAIIMYGKSILLNPKNESGKNKLKKLLEEGK